MTRKESRSGVNPDTIISRKQTAGATILLQALDSSATKICYIQYNGPYGAIISNELKRTLISKNWLIPPVEPVEKKFISSIRYFHPEDQKDAKKLAVHVLTLSTRLYNIPPPPNGININYIPKLSNEVPRGHFEVWFNTTDWSVFRASTANINRN
jgi:hypothetical protein